MGVSVPYVNNLSDKCSGYSIANFIRCDKLKSDNMFRICDLIHFNGTTFLFSDCGCLKKKD